MDEKLNMTIRMDVKGKEGLYLEIGYLDTDMTTVLLIEKALVGVLNGLLDGQIKSAVV